MFGNLENINLNEKFDYIVVTDYLQKHDLEESIKIVKEYLKEDGIILLAVDNKFGIKKWNGKDLYRNLLGNSDKNSNKEYGKKELEDIIHDLGYKNLKFFYIFPEYKAPNLIFSDEHEISAEDITRNFELNEEGE